jgi:WD40 repeat protein
MPPPTPLRLLTALAGLLLTLAAAPGRAGDAARTDAHGDPLPDGAVARAGTVRWRAGAPIVLSAYLADGRSVLTVSQQHVAQVWDATSGKELRRFDVSGGVPVDPRIDAAGFLMGTANRGVAVSADGQTLAVSGRDGNVRVWDVTAGKELARLEREAVPRAEVLALSRDGKRLARTSPMRTTVYEAATGKVLSRFDAAPPAPGPGGRAVRGLIMASRVEFGPDGKTLLMISGERDLAARTTKMVLTIWDIEGGKQVKRLDEWPAPPAGGPGGRRGGGPGVRTAALTGTALSPDFKLAALPLDAKTVVLFDLGAGKELRRVDVGGGLWAMAFTADGKSLVFVTGRGTGSSVYDVAGDKLTKGKGAEAPAPPGLGGGIARAGRSIVLAGDGKSYLWPEGPTLHLFDLAAGKDRNATGGNTTAVGQVLFTGDGKSLLTVAADGAIIRWDAATGKASASFAPPARAGGGGTLSPDGKVLAVADAADDVMLFDPATGKPRHALKFGDGPFGRVVAFSPDSATVAVAGVGARNVRLYDVATGLSKREFLLPAPADEDTADLLPRHVAFSADGRLVAVSDAALHVWEAASGREVRVLPIPEGAVFHGAAFSPDGRTLAMELTDGEIQVIELASGKPRLVLNPRERAKPDPDAPPVLLRPGARFDEAEAPLAFAPDGRLLAQAGDAGRVRLWDLRTGKEAASPAGHRGRVTALAFSPDGTRLATGGGDTAAVVWDADAVRKKLPGRAGTLSQDKAEALWSNLGGDAGRAYEAVSGLAGDPARALPLLRQRLKPAAGADAKLLAKLIADLDADDFDTREKAKKELARLGEAAAGALRKARQNSPPAEVKRSIDELLAGLDGSAPSDDRLVLARALEALEMIATPEAAEVLKSLAGGSPDAYLTTEAKAALERLRASRK